mmetsp:Transcript_62114/g.148138  ORF Transcript_62114/g.148138 Transcript_62114/m.148138 type:complete len:214 (+) Transcript_62114:129-770(+)
MGIACCKVTGVEGHEEDMSNKKLVSGEALLEMLEAKASELHSADSSFQRKPSTKVLINLELVETILMEQQEEDGLEDEGTDAPAKPAQKARGRKGTGFVTKEQVEAALSKSDRNSVSFAEEGEVQEQEPKQEGRSKTRKPTGFVTKEKLLQALADMSDDDDDEDRGAEEKKDAPPKPVAKPAPAPVRGGKRKGTGFVSKKQLQKVIDIYGDDE